MAEPGATPAPAAQVVRRRSRLLVVLAAVLTGAAVLAGVFVAGWAMANTLVVSPQDRPQAETSVVTLPDTAMRGGVRMPDVRGLDAGDAQQALVDAGIDAAIVTLSERPAAGAPGRVVQQMPVFGTRNPAAVSIVVATPATVPESVGREAAAVVADLQRLGARVVQTRVYEPEATVGHAVGTVPAAGEPVPEVVELFIADTASELSLQDIETRGSRPSWRTDTLFAGQSVDAIAEFSADRPTSVKDYSWQLSGAVTLIQGRYALAEGQDPAFGGELVVLADGVEIARLAPGVAAADFRWDVRGVQTLVIRAVRSVPEKDSRLVLLDPVALGSYELMRTLSSP